MTKWIYDWPQIIRDLQADAYTASGKRDVRKAAGSWVTCACGNLCDEIPRGWLGMPLDDHLSYAGADFTNAIVALCNAQTVHEREIYAIGARYYMFRIEQRAAELLEGSGADIVYLKTKNGKNMPCDAATVDHDDYQFDAKKHTSHFATCPDADQHRRK